MRHIQSLHYNKGDKLAKKKKEKSPALLEPEHVECTVT